MMNDVVQKANEQNQVLDVKRPKNIAGIIIAAVTIAKIGVSGAAMMQTAASKNIRLWIKDLTACWTCVAVNDTVAVQTR